MKRGVGRLLLGLALVAILVSLVPVSTFGTNGYFSLGYGTKNKGMGGTGVAIPTGPLSAATNPALLFYVGNKYELSLDLFNPNREYTITGMPSGYPGTFPLTPGTIESENPNFFIPALGANWIFAEKNSFGIIVYGNGGMNTEYDTKTFNHPLLPVAEPTGINVEQLFIGLTYSRELSLNHSIGITTLFANQTFEVTGLEVFMGFSSAPDKLTGTGKSSSTGYGARIGYYGKFSPQFALGVSYQTKIAMGKFDEYKGLFAEEGGFDIPSNYTIGIAYMPTTQLTFALDYQQIAYSEVNSIANPMDPADFMMGILLGDDEGAGFGWEDMSIIKFGFQYAVENNWALRFGYSQGKQPIPDTELMFNILAPGVIETHFTLGFSKSLCGKELNIAVVRAFSNSVVGENPMEAPGQQEIELKMDQWEFEVGLTF